MDAPNRILIVDDEPNVRLVFRTALEATGYQVTEATDGDAAGPLPAAGSAAEYKTNLGDDGEQ